MHVNINNALVSECKYRISDMSYFHAFLTNLFFLHQNFYKNNEVECKQQIV